MYLTSAICPGCLHILTAISGYILWKYRLTAAEEELLVSFLDTAAWYIASRSFTDTVSPSWSSALRALSSGRPDLDLPGLPAAKHTEPQKY